MVTQSHKLIFIILSLTKKDIRSRFLQSNIKIKIRILTAENKKTESQVPEQEQQILVEHIENCRRQKANIAFQMDRENVAEGAFAKMLTESFEEKEEVKEEKDA